MFILAMIKLTFKILKIIINIIIYYYLISFIIVQTVKNKNQKLSDN